MNLFVSELSRKHHAENVMHLKDGSELSSVQLSADSLLSSSLP